MYFHLPTEGQSTAEHILSTYRADQKFTHEEARLLDLCLLVHADHGGGNCSTFTCRVLSSSGTDTYAAISSAIGALKGPKHGGANLKVMHQLDYILENVEDPSNDDEVREFLRKIIRKERGDGSGLIDQMGVKRGLRNLDGTGVLAGITNVSNVIGYDKKEDGTIVPIPGRLVYRGIDIDTLAAEADAHDRFMFEEVIWLLLFGSLPTQEQYAKFRKLLEHHRELPQGFADDMILNSPSPNLMNKMARSVLAMYSYDEHAEDNSLPNILRQSINLIAELPTMMVNAYQIDL